MEQIYEKKLKIFLWEKILGKFLES